MLVYFFNSIFSEVMQNRKLGSTSVNGVSRQTFTQEIADMAYGYLTTAPK
jgi:hypothetical protein